MTAKHWIALLALSVISSSSVLAQSSAFSSGDRAPIPFKDPYRDGYVLVLWWHHSDADLSKIIARVKQTGAKHLIIPYFGCQSTIKSSDVGACQIGNQNQSVSAARIALGQGMGVTFLPILVTPRWDARSTFDPTDAPAWFISYKAWLKKLLRISNQLHLKEFIVGTEFTKLYRYEHEWSQLLNEFHRMYSGPLILTVNWDSLDHQFWSEADAIGVSAYQPLSQNGSPSQDELDSGMQAEKSELLEVARKWNRPIYITEMGFPSSHAAALTPWLSRASDGVDRALQNACFEAMDRSWRAEVDLVRLSVWATSDPGAGDFQYGFETLGKSAEAPIRSFFAGRARLAR